MTHVRKKSLARLIKELEQVRSQLRLLKDAESTIKEAERDIISSEKLSRSILDTLDANIAVLDNEGVILDVNDSWVGFALDNGITSLDKACPGVNYFDVCRRARGSHSEESAAALKGLESLLAGDTNRFELEYPCDSPDKRRWFVMAAKRLETDGRQLLVVSHSDITARKLAEEAVQGSNIALEEQIRTRTRELERAKMEAELYLDIMSHDLANINQALLGYLEMTLEKAHASPEISEFLNRSLELVQRSSELIQRVKTVRMSSMGDGRLERTDLAKSVAAAVQRFRRIAGRHIEIHYMPGSGHFVLANELLPEVFVNIIGNAIKHSSPSKGLVIDIRTDTAISGRQKSYNVSICDNGPGIPDDMKGGLFEPGSISRPRGIGMILVKSIIDLFKGTIEVKDRVTGDYRHGTCFMVTLPAAEP
jgi:signal transduction histidine kinase